MTLGTNILASQFVAIQDKAQSILGTGSTTRGYGQTVQSADVFTGNTITKAQWDALRYDIINIRLHQDGVVPAIATVNVGDPIGYGVSSPNTNYDILMEQAVANRFNIAGNQSAVAAVGNVTYSSAWSTQAQTVITVTFLTAAAARYFFNSGGKIRASSQITGGSATPQVNAWKNFLASVGTVSFGADTGPFVNFYTLTNSYQTFYTNSLSTPYSANSYRLEASCNVSDNSSGTATQILIRITLLDSYVDPVPDPVPTTGFVPSAAGFPPGDTVDGTLTISVQELKASGQLQPSGTFTVTSPTYSLSAISAS
jgi:hypothetical protein